MAYTIAIVVSSTLVFPYMHFPKDIVAQEISSTTLIQIDAAVMIGALFFLQIVPRGNCGGKCFGDYPDEYN
jgi:hypothetical protein